MNWMGKLIGGAIGYVLGGPLGAIGGAVIGDFFEKQKKPVRSANIRANSAEQKQYIFFLTMFSLLGKIAKADGKIDDREIHYFRELIQNDFGSNIQAIRFAERIFQQAIVNDDSFENIAHQFYDNFSEDKRILLTMIELLVRMATADGEYHETEETYILHAVSAFGLNQDEYEAIKRRYVKDTDSYYAILESKPTDSFETIKSNYKRLVREYHPDRIMSRGLPDEYIKFTKEKFLQIQHAYEQLRKQYGSAT